MKLCEYEQTLTENEFKSKVDSMFILLCISIMIDNLKKVSNFLNETLLNKYQDDDSYHRIIIVTESIDLQFKNLKTLIKLIKRKFSEKIEKMEIMNSTISSQQSIPHSGQFQ